MSEDLYADEGNFDEKDFEEPKTPLGLDSLMFFGKYKDKSISDILQSDFKYLMWVKENSKNVVFKQDVLNAIDNKLEDSYCDDDFCGERDDFSHDEGHWGSDPFYEQHF